jgi:hypothetical protein
VLTVNPKRVFPVKLRQRARSLFDQRAQVDGRPGLTSTTFIETPSQQILIPVTRVSGMRELLDARAAMREVIRRLRLLPEVQLIGTRYRRSNEAAANLYRSLGFIPWKVPWHNSDPDEVYMALHEAGQAGTEI